VKLNVEEKLILSEFQPRPYQEPILDAIFNRHIKRMVIVLPRRAGKDLTLFNAAIQQCLERPCMVLYVLQSYGNGCKAIWDALDLDGKKFLDYIPKSTILKTNNSEMKIVFKNNSVLQIVGAESYQSALLGTNPSAIILSEFAYYFNGNAVLDVVSPIIAANPKGWLAIASTPRGKNAFWQIYTIAKTLPDWWTYIRTVDDTGHIPLNELENERKRMSYEKFREWYYCDFNRGVEGAIFGRALDSLRLNGHITYVVHQPQLLVHVCIDIGLSRGNATTIIWFQVIGDGQMINIIDCYSSENLGLDFYAALLQEKQQKYGYKMGISLAPHDLAVREWGGGAVTRYEKAKQLDINFTILDQHLLADQIENALTHFPKVWIDEIKCKSLIDALENYYREWDENNQVYKRNPVHNWASNYASAFMGMFLGLHHTYTTTRADEYEKIRNEALYGVQGNLPRIFRQGLKNQGY
jgi:phage terminase large subunit